MSQFRTRRRIEFADTDMAGIVHFANFFRFMETAELEFLKAHGLSFNWQWQNEMLGFPRVSAMCNYLKPARFEDVLDISVRVQNIGRKSVTYTFEFFNGTELIAQGEVSTVCCRVGDNDQFESLEIPAAFRERLEAGLPK